MADNVLHPFDTDNTRSGRPEQTPARLIPSYRRVAQWCGVGTLLIGISGLLGWIFGIPELNSIIPGLKPIAVSASIVFILLGGVQFLAARVLLRRTAAIVLLGITLFITLFGLLEIIYLVTGVYLTIEDAVLRHYPSLFANQNAHTSPAAGVLVFLIGLAQTLYLYQGVIGRPVRAMANVVGLLGSLVILSSAVFLLGYLFGTPLHYGTAYIPISLPTSLALLLSGIGMVTLNGGEALPLSGFIGKSTRARLLRAFLPLTVLVLLLSNSAAYFLEHFTHVNPALSAAILTLLVEIVIGTIILQVARVIGNQIDRAEEEREASLRQLVEERSRLQTVLEILPVGVLILDDRNQIIETNGNAERIYAGSARLTQPMQEYRKGKAWWTATGQPLREDDWPSMQALKQGQATPGREIDILRADGTHATIFDISAPLRDQQGHIVGAVVVIQDITDRKRAEEELQRLTETLEQRVRERTAALEAANRELEAFSYSVSHDLRAPLRGINGFSKVLLEQYADRLDEHGRDCLERVRAAAQRMNRLIDDMLNLSRIGRKEMIRTTVNLSKLAASVIEDLRRHDPERQVEVDIMPGILVTGDADLLRIVLNNLLSNAWKFTGPRETGRIELGMQVLNGERVYCVRDNGVGFDMTYADKLFTPFQRPHTEAEFPGTGIGLAIVQHIIARHGGRVWAEGAEGQGATVYFTLGEENA